MQRAYAERIVSLAIDGVPPAEIETSLDGQVSRDSIYRVLRIARDAGKVIPFFTTSGRLAGEPPPPQPKRGPRPQTAPPPPARTVIVPRDILDMLDLPAAKRGMSAVALAREIVTIVAEDGLIDAILDDAERQ